MKILVLNGPNLARLDIRDSNHYGNLNWDELKNLIIKALQGTSLTSPSKQVCNVCLVIIFEENCNNAC